MRPVRVLLSIALAIACFSGTASAHAAPLSAAEVSTLGAARNGETVEFAGEAVGDVLRAGSGYSWVNLLSGGSAVGVYVANEYAEQVVALGDYRATGSTVVVSGRYNASCDQHGGDLDVHAVTFEVTDAGAPRSRPVHLWKGAAGVAFLIAASATWARYRARRQRMP